MKTYSEACEQNKQPILQVLQDVFKDTKSVLEIGSGTGQHAVYFAEHLRHLDWQPSDLAPNIPSIQARLDEAALPNLHHALTLNVEEQLWQVTACEAIFSANTLHIMSWEMVEQFFNGVGRYLGSNGKLLVYGPFSYQGQHISASNAKFDQYLKQRDPLSGVRDFEGLNTLAKDNDLEFIQDYAMPANNRTLFWQKT